MFINPRDYKIFLRPAATDMRKSHHSLSVLVENELELDLFSKHLFLFCSRNRRQIKILYWDRNGFCLWQKKLVKDKFPWPKDAEEVRELSYTELMWLLEGIDFFHAHKTLQFERIS